MAFCNSCGTNLAPGAQFCNKCGTRVSAAGAMASAPPPAAIPAQAPGGANPLKIVLIVIAVIVGLGILSVGAFSFFVYRMARNAHVTQHGDNVKVETPFGSVETSKDFAQTAKDLGVDVYPGATVQSNGTATMTFGGTRTVTAAFETSDSVDKVCDFYKSKFPASSTTTSDQNHCSIISGDPKNMITVAVQANGSGSKIQIANVNKKLN